MKTVTYTCDMCGKKEDEFHISVDLHSSYVAEEDNLSNVNLDLCRECTEKLYFDIKLN